MLLPLKIIYVLLLFYLPIIVVGQINYKVNIESGAYLNLADNSEEDFNSIHKLFGSINYKHRFNNSQFDFGIKIRPQFFGLGFHSFKYGIDGLYQYGSEEFSWQSHIHYNSYSLNDVNENPLLKTFTLLNQFDFFTENRFTFSTKIGYAHQEINEFGSISSNYLFLNPILNRSIDNYTDLGFGIYAQKFDTERNSIDQNLLFSSNGWKYGPSVSFNYLRKILLNVEYKFLIHNSEHVIYPSYEHNINLLFGTVVSKNLSVFMLIQMNFIRTKVKQNISDLNPIYLFPTQNDNKVYLKISYKIVKHVSFYSKIGYFRENLFLDNLELNGLNFLGGIQIRK